MRRRSLLAFGCITVLSVPALAQEPAAQAMRIDARLGGQHAHEQLFLRHFEAEHADRFIGPRAHVLRDVQHEARLAHRRPCRDDDEVRRLKT